MLCVFVGGDELRMCVSVCIEGEREGGKKKIHPPTHPYVPDCTCTRNNVASFINAKIGRGVLLPHSALGARTPAVTKAEEGNSSSFVDDYHN